MPEIEYTPVLSKDTLATCQETEYYMPWITRDYYQDVEHATRYITVCTNG
jgi:hypothetical protein